MHHLSGDRQQLQIGRSEELIWQLLLMHTEIVCLSCLREIQSSQAYIVQPGNPQCQHICDNTSKAPFKGLPRSAPAWNSVDYIPLQFWWFLGMFGCQVWLFISEAMTHCGLITSAYGHCAIIQITIVITASSRQPDDTFCQSGAGVWM